MPGPFISLKPDLRPLNRSLEEHGRSVRQAAHEKAVETALNLLANTVRLTPVHTGRARSGWHVSSNPDSHWTPDEGGSFPDEAQIIQREQGRAAGRQGLSLFLINNVDYIVSLEYGRSRQAPAGMVRSALEELRVKLVSEGNPFL